MPGEVDSKELERELDQLENSLNLLKREYEIFFSGAVKQAPRESKKRLEKTIQRYTSMQGLSYAQRFRFNSLVARFNSYMDLWNKQMRYKEEGRTPSGAIPLIPENNNNKLKTQPVTPAGSNGAEAKLEKIFEEYLKRREETGEGRPNLKFQDFCKIVSKQREAIVSKYRCKDVDFYVKIEGGHARLKARPVQ
jgi:hypothetical protein